ncbi:hypothetical protein M3661_03450 [Paenibacillus sp. MER 180]|uniref:hypothetical protein n=1 Tax=Paenibacillus sp. MER 180 TaxID=2939570 RepID=UPI00203B3D2E|nr:hypothetical protein [Paenibacillus sp. MER 180]MCM3289179.1 hypothetical protein [Paenibacillus sp. MER 180]
MDKEEARQHLYEHVLQPALEEQVSVVARLFHDQQERLVAEWIESFRGMCMQIAQMQRRGEKAPIGFIHYSVLRTSVLEGTCTYQIEAYSDDWYWDPAECFARYDARWALQGLTALIELLYERRKMYMGMLHAADVERMVLQHIGAFSQFVTALARDRLRGKSGLREVASFTDAWIEIQLRQS